MQRKVYNMRYENKKAQTAKPGQKRKTYVEHSSTKKTQHTLHEDVSVKIQPQSTEENDGDYVTQTTAAQLQKKLKDELLRKSPRYEVVKQLLDLDFPERKHFIKTVKGDVRLILEKYSCFHQPNHLQDEMSRHLQKSLEGLKAKWELEVNIILKYGEEKKLLNISLAWSLEKKTSEALQILPDLFAAGKSAPTGLKKSEMLLQFVDDLEKKEEAMQKSKKREVWLLGVPSHRKCFVLIKGQPLCELNSMVEAFFTLLSASYTFSVCYHECVGPAMMWLESAFLGDERVNTKDMTSCKKSIQSYLDFKEKLTSPCCSFW
ncbi:uncharacterized protein LOC117395064 [Acipenser ruthenus]|uniref:uncharacterized protein LOC117395064 n=1 Tax=Acipenser ruthenus TaxID=7906 RepID=UPI002740DD93|nr:uncharacterized protein LOC117395064 [Acipenser ruthenus]